MRVKVTAGLERFITFITAIGPLAGVSLEMSTQQALGFEHFPAVRLGALQAGGLVGRAPVVSQAVGGGELPDAVGLLAAEHLHLLQPPVLLAELLVSLPAASFFLLFGSCQLPATTRTTNTINLKNYEVLVTS